MIETLRDWVRALAAAGLFTAAVLTVAPKGAAGKTVRLVCSLLLMAVFLGPLRRLDFSVFAEAVSRQRLLGRELSQQATGDTELLYRTIIQEETEAYILDKAARLGAEELQVEVTLKHGDEAPYPWLASLRGKVTPEQRRALTLCLEGELGIPAERQVWDVDDGD